MKAIDQTVDHAFLAARAQRAAGFPKAKWIEFCEAMLARRYTVTLREARESVSKYLTVWNMGYRFRVRYSNHPETHLGRAETCDFFVGKRSDGTFTNTQQAIDATVVALGPSPWESLTA